MLFLFYGSILPIIFTFPPLCPSLWKREELVLESANIGESDVDLSNIIPLLQKKLPQQMPRQSILKINRRLLLCLLWELELGHTCTNEDIEPRESLLDIRDVNTLAVVLGQHLAEVSLHLIGGLLV